MVSTRRQRRLPTATNRENGRARHGRNETPPRSLRKRPTKTEKGTEYQSSQKQKRRKMELLACRRSPAPSTKIDLLTPKTPKTAGKSPFSMQGKRAASSEKKIESKKLLSSFSSPVMDPKSSGVSKQNSNVFGQKNDAKEASAESKDTEKENGDQDEKKLSDGIGDDEKENGDKDENKLSDESGDDEKENDDKDLEGLLEGNKLSLESIPPKRSPKLPSLFEGLAYSSFSAIDDNLRSGALTFARKFTDQEVQFPLSYTCATKDDRLAIRKNPEEVDDVREIYCGTSILDLATQWTFMDTDPDSPKEKDWCPLPASTFYYMSRGEYKEGSDLAKIVSLNPNTDNLLQYKVIDLVIHHAGHFSRMFIMNVELVISGDAFCSMDTTDPTPCIIHVDSIRVSGEDHSSYHDTDKCAKQVRKFLNQYGKSKYGYKNFFNKNTLPAFNLKVPPQKDGWSCGFYSLYYRYCFMKFIDLRTNITIEHTSCPEGLEEIVEDHFSCDEADVMELRFDLLYLVESMQKIKDYSNDKTKSIDFERYSSDYDVSGDFIDLTIEIDEKPTEFEGIHLGMSQEPSLKKCETKKTKKKLSVRELREKARRDVMERRNKDGRLEEFHGKLNANKRPGKAKAVERARLPPSRVRGEAAPSLRSYKDKSFRRALYRCVESSKSFQLMTQYSSEDANRTTPKMTSIAFIKDPLAEYPDREGGEFCPFRSQPLRIALCQNRQDLDDFIKDLIQNKDKYICESDVSKIDRLIVGDERVPLRAFVTKTARREICVQEMAENTKALANTNRLQQTPAKGQKSVVEDEMDEAGMDAIFG